MRLDKSHFESCFENYNPAEGTSWGFNWRAAMKKRTEIALDMAAPMLKKKGVSVLEVGCAAGDVTKQVLDMCRELERYDALDISENAIRICEGKGLDRGGKVRFLCGSIVDQPLSAGTYDLVLCMDVIYYLSKEDQRRSMEKLYEAMKPGGRLLVCVPYEEREIFTLLNSKGRFEIEMIQMNRNVLWAGLDRKLVGLYGRKDISPKVKRGLYRFLSNQTLMELSYRLCCRLKLERYTHFYILYRKGKSA